MDYGDKQYYIALQSLAEDDNLEDKERENYARKLRESFESVKKKAEAGDAAAMYNLAMHYEYDFGTTEDEDDSIAFSWYEKAALQGLAGAMHNVAWAYRRCFGVQPDREKAAEWQKKAIFAFHAEKEYEALIHAFRCMEDYLPDEEIIALFAKIRHYPEVKE
jgi:TPR repeat protein